MQSASGPTGEGPAGGTPAERVRDSLRWRLWAEVIIASLIAAPAFAQAARFMVSPGEHTVELVRR